MPRPFGQIPYVGSFQRGAMYRSSNPLEAAWRRIERVGTIDNMGRIASYRSQPSTVGKPAALKIRQAVELRRAARDASVLTKPLLLYYAMLNLARGLMLAIRGEYGPRMHGLTYESGKTLLDCKAVVSSKGTFRTFAQTLGMPDSEVDKKSYSLRDVFAVIPEMLSDFRLLSAGDPAVCFVSVTSYIRGPTLLDYGFPNMEASEFEARWSQLLPWMTEVCTYDAPFRLRTKVQLNDESLVAEFCRRYLMHDLRWRENAVWFDHLVRGGIALLPRLASYMVAMFILSNVVRYEPDYLEESAVHGTDLGFFLGSFLENAERFFPQLLLELMEDRAVYFE